jgi:ABC-2 type transport system permease protein
MTYFNEMQQVSDERMRRLASLELETRKQPRNPVSGFITAIRELREHRNLLGLLVRREVVGRYKDSVLGFAWSLIRPLTQLLIYYLVMGQFLGAARSIENFAVYIFTGLTLYSLFSETLTAMTGSIIANAGLVKKVYLPREIFPLATLGSSLFNFILQMVILVAAALLTGSLTSTNVYFRDVQYLVEVLMMLLMWFSPIVYSWTFVHDAFVNFGVPWLTEIYIDNPLTLAVLGFQVAFWAPSSPTASFPPELMTRMGIAIVFGLILVWVGQRIFARLQGNFAQEL